FFVDGGSVGTTSQAPWQVTWNLATVANGSHTITATATDSAGNSPTSAGATITVNNYPSPTTAITSPTANASLSGPGNVPTTNTVASGQPGDCEQGAQGQHRPGAVLAVHQPAGRRGHDPHDQRGQRQLPFHLHALERAGPWPEHGCA